MKNCIADFDHTRRSKCPDSPTIWQNSQRHEKILDTSWMPLCDGPVDASTSGGKQQRQERY